jgi:hypothetical protein
MTRDEWQEWLAKSWDEAQGVAARGCGKGLREWVGLTDEERWEVVGKKWWDWEDSFDVEAFARAIEAKLKEKNL